MDHELMSARAAWLGVLFFTSALAVPVVSARVVADGDTGVLYVNGELTQGACNIATDSRWQTLAMGNISSGELAWPGQMAHGRAFHIHLQDCVSHGTEEETRQTGGSVRVTDRPAVRISFISEQDASNPQLVAVEGAEGFGLRLEDSQHRSVAVNRRGEPMVLQAGSDELTFWLIPERTRAALHEGAWRSVVNMKFSYE